MRTALMIGPALAYSRKIQGGQHAERHDHQRHQQRHGRRAPDGGKDAPFGVGVARLVGQELPPPRADKAPSLPPRSRVGWPDRRGRRRPGAQIFSLPSAVASRSSKAGVLFVQPAISSVDAGCFLGRPTRLMAAQLLLGGGVLRGCFAVRPTRRLDIRPRRTCFFLAADGTQILSFSSFARLQEPLADRAWILVELAPRPRPVRWPRPGRRCEKPWGCRRSGPSLVTRSTTSAHSGRGLLGDLEIADPVIVRLRQLEVACVESAGDSRAATVLVEGRARLARGRPPAGRQATSASG